MAEEAFDVDKYLKENYGFMAWAFDHAELGPILRKAAEGKWGPVELEAAIRETKWWTDQEAAARQFEQQRAEDPGSLEADIQTRMLDLKVSASQLGVTVSHQRLRALATESLKFAWQANEIRSALLAEAEFTAGEPVSTGSLGETRDNLSGVADQYFVPVSERTLFDWSKQIVEGTATEQDYLAYVRDIATSRFPHLKPYIERGIAPQTFFEPYAQTLARELEVNPMEIDFNSPKYSEIIDFAPSDDGTRRPMTLYEARQWARKQEEWNYTDAANQEGARLTRSLLETFGAI